MKEQFDKKLVDKIKDSFHHHEEPFDPKQWEKLSQAYFKPKSGSFPPWGLWVAGIAASLVLVFFLLPEKEFKEDNLLSLADTLSAESKSFKVEEKQETDKSTEFPADIDEYDDDEPLRNETATSPKSQVLKEMAEQNQTIKVDIGQYEAGDSANKVVDRHKEQVAFAEKPEREGKVDELEVSAGTEVNKGDILGKIREETEALTLTNQLVENDENEAQKSINEWLNEVQPDLESGKTLASSKEPIKLGVLLTPQTISNSTQSLNLGAGLMSEFSFSKKIKLDVGLAYARQNLSPGSIGNNSAGFLDMADGGQRMNTLSTNFINASYELSFGQLEIPVNLKYRVFENKESQIYLITGLSNMVYLNQQNVGTFSNASLATSNFATSQAAVETYSQTFTPESNSSGIDTGRMINISFGYEHSLKGGTYFSLEPFYKLPIGNQTFINQQFSIGGLNLRMNFQLKNKKQ